MHETLAPAPLKQTMDVNEIMAILPHRYPFLLIDRVVEITPKQRIVALKNVTINEPFFQGHFPGYPIMPGVLIVEAMAQAGGALLLTEIPDRADKLMVFTGIEEAKFRRPVTPRRPGALRGRRAAVAQPRRQDAGKSLCRRQARLRGHRDVPARSPPAQF